MPDTITIPDRVRKIVAEHLGSYHLGRTIPREFEWEDSLRDDLGADSLDEVELCMALEEEFQVEITDDEAEGWKTPGDMLRTIEGKRTDG